MPVNAASLWVYPETGKGDSSTTGSGGRNGRSEEATLMGTLEPGTLLGAFAVGFNLHNNPVK